MFDSFVFCIRINYRPGGNILVNPIAKFFESAEDRTIFCVFVPNKAPADNGNQYPAIGYSPEVVKPTELEELGFKAAAGNVKAKRELARKMRIAFEHFSVVTPEHVRKFNEALEKKTRVGYTYQTLSFTPIEQYSEVPPAQALAKLREARKLECFDTYVVAHIQSVTKVPDPILFGMIAGSGNYYYIAQWDDDVKIEDILKDDERLNG